MKRTFFAFALLCCCLLLAQPACAWYQIGIADRLPATRNGTEVFCYDVRDICALTLNFEPPKSGDIALVNFGAGNWDVIVVKSVRYEGSRPVFEQGGARAATAAEVQRGESLRVELGFN